MMFIKNRKVIISFLLVAIAGGLLLIFYLLRQTSKTENPTNPELSPTTTIAIGKNGQPKNPYQESELSIAIATRVDLSSIPQKAFSYKVDNKPMTEIQITALASKLGFTQRALKAKDAVYGETYTYYQNSDYMTVFPNQRIIDFKTGTDDTDLQSFNPIPSKDEIEKAATDYLVAKGFIQSKDEVKSQNVSFFYLDLGGHITTGNVKNNTARITFNKEISGIAITGSFYNQGTIEVLLNPKKEVTSVRMTQIARLTEANEYSVKTEQEIRSTIKQATLQTLDNGQLPLEDFLSRGLRIHSIIVNKATLAYVLDSFQKDEILFPTLVLEGTASLSNFTSVPAMLYLPAVANQ